MQIFATRSILSVVLLGFPLCAPRAFAQLPPEALTAGETWLRKDCSSGEPDQITPVLRRFKPQFEQFFLNALSSGPPPELIAHVEAAASRVFALRQGVLKTGKGLGLSATNLEYVRSITRQQYVAGERSSFVSHYKYQAVSGLAIVAGERGKAALRALAADPGSPLQSVAREALGQLQ
jgi:hypothetical protein